MIDRKTQFRRTLTLNKEFYDVMQLPQVLHNASIDKIPDSVKPRIEKLLAKLDSALCDGVGACIYGTPGCGKSSIASVIAKAARSREFKVRWTTVWALRDGLRDTFSGNRDTIYDLAKTVDLLVIDQFRAGDFDEQKTFGLRDFIALLEHRKNNNLSTILTLNDHPYQYGAVLPAVLAAARPGMVSVEVSGPDLRADKNEKLTDEYFGSPIIGF